MKLSRLYRFVWVAVAVTAPPADITIDHSGGTSKIFDLDLNHGQKFVVRVTNTCPDAFDYSYAGVERGRVPQLQGEAPLAKKPLSDKDIELVYDERFGGYVFNITLKDANKPAADVCEKAEKLGPLSFIVSVRQQQWNLSFGGGFTVSTLTNPVFALRTENGVKKIFEERDKQDSRKLGAASFVHLFHDGVHWKKVYPALSFGLGINSDNRAEYLVGLGFRFGDKAVLSLGGVWGSVSRLPNGVTFDTPITDDNTLNNLGSQVKARLFFALSYSFIDTKDRLLKPFAQQEPAAAKSGPETQADDKLPAIKEAAVDPKTYEGTATLKDLIGPNAKPKLEICGADAAPAGKPVTVQVHVKDATPGQLQTMTKASAEAISALIKAVPNSQISQVTFDTACKP